MVFESIKSLLEQNGIKFQLMHHEPTFTSEESAAARNVPLAWGGKTLLMKIGEGETASFKLFSFSAARKLNSRAIKDHFGEKYFRFATKEELMEMTGLPSGSVPPFGRPILDFENFVDNSILANEKIAFNAGSLTDSIIMNTADFVRMAKPTVFDFSQ